MARKQTKYHFIYKTVNNLSGKYYIGMHSTDNLDDGYMGSGTYLKRSLNKHGIENHTIEILEFLDSREELKAREEQIVNLNEIAKEDCMNMKVGGIGGLSSDEHRRKFHEAGARANNIKYPNGIHHFHLDKLMNDPEYRRKYSEAISKGLTGLTRRPHTVETKLKMSKSQQGKHVGKLNSQYGTHWITNGTINNKTKGNLIPEGWYLGRI